MTVVMAALFTVLVFAAVWCAFGFYTWYRRDRFWRQIGRR